MNERNDFSHLMFIRAVVAHPWPRRERCGIIAVATALASHAQVRSGDRCYPSTKTLVKEAGVSAPTLFKAKRRLRDARFLEWRAEQLQGNAYRHHYTLRIPDKPTGQVQTAAAGQSEGSARSSSDTGRRSNTDSVTKTLERREENGTISPRSYLDGSDEENKRAETLMLKATGAHHRIGPSPCKVKEEVLRARAAGVPWDVLERELLRPESAGQNVWVITDPLREDARLRWKEPAHSVRDQPSDIDADEVMPRDRRYLDELRETIAGKVTIPELIAQVQRLERLLAGRRFTRLSSDEQASAIKTLNDAGMRPGDVRVAIDWLLAHPEALDGDDDVTSTIIAAFGRAAKEEAKTGAA